MCPKSFSGVKICPWGPSFRVEYGLLHLQWLESPCYCNYSFNMSRHLTRNPVPQILYCWCKIEVIYCKYKMYIRSIMSHPANIILCMSCSNHVPSGDTLRRDTISSYLNVAFIRYYKSSIRL